MQIIPSFARSKKLIENLNDLNGYIPYEEQKCQLEHANTSIFYSKQKIVRSLSDFVSFRVYSGQYLERLIFWDSWQNSPALPTVAMPKFSQVYNK